MKKNEYNVGDLILIVYSIKEIGSGTEIGLTDVHIAGTTTDIPNDEV